MDKLEILVVNCGSSSLKFSLIHPPSGAASAQGVAEKLGTPDAVLKIKGREEIPIPNAGHKAVLDTLFSRIDCSRVCGVGHRVVHGGESFAASVQVDGEVLKGIRKCSELAPLHNPASLMGIEAAMRLFPALPHVAVFDTAFHQKMPDRAYLYAVPYALYENHHIRKYGFHGTSYRYVAPEAARLLGKPLEDLQMIVAHLGNGCSACAIREGRSVDTTMGLTPSEGLAMGTRSGDVDPNLHEYLSRHTSQSLGEITTMLNRESGLLGLSGLSNDMRSLTGAAAAGNTRAAIAIEVFCYRLAKGILGLSAALDQVDAVVFTGGIGENSAVARGQTLSFLSLLGMELDIEANEIHGAKTRGFITSEASRTPALVVPTNEEIVVARDTAGFTRTEF